MEKCLIRSEIHHLGHFPMQNSDLGTCWRALQKIGQTVNEYKESLTSHFKDMDVDVKDWHFTVGKLEKE